MTNVGFQGIGAQEGPLQQWPGLLHDDGDATQETETLAIWLLRRDGTIAFRMTEVGQWRQVALPLPAIARALALTGATGLLMAHNHPSGDPSPSHADIDATRQVWRLARALGASLQDHLIIGRRRNFSFRASGLL